MFTSQTCARRAHRNPLAYIHPPNVAKYIQYQNIYSNVTCSSNTWHNIFNTNVHLSKYTLPQKPYNLHFSPKYMPDKANINVHTQHTMYIVHTQLTYISKPIGSMQPILQRMSLTVDNICDTFVHLTFHYNLAIGMHKVHRELSQYRSSN